MHGENQKMKKKKKFILNQSIKESCAPRDTGKFPHGSIGVGQGEMIMTAMTTKYEYLTAAKGTTLTKGGRKKKERKKKVLTKT